MVKSAARPQRQVRNMKNVSNEQTLVFAPDGIYTRDMWQIEAYKQVSPELKDKNIAALAYLPAGNVNGGKCFAIQVAGNRVIAVLTQNEYQEATGIKVEAPASLEQNLPPAIAAQIAAQQKNKGGRPRKVV